MTAAIAEWMDRMSLINSKKDIERIVVGDLANGLYPLAILVKRKEE